MVVLGRAATSNEILFAACTLRGEVYAFCFDVGCQRIVLSSHNPNITDQKNRYTSCTHTQRVTEHEIAQYLVHVQLQTTSLIIILALFTCCYTSGYNNKQHTLPDSTVSEDTTPDLSVGEQL